jgi:hypothetical protein
MAATAMVDGCINLLERAAAAPQPVAATDTEVVNLCSDSQQDSQHTLPLSAPQQQEKQELLPAQQQQQQHWFMPLPQQTKQLQPVFGNDTAAYAPTATAVAGLGQGRLQDKAGLSQQQEAAVIKAEPPAPYELAASEVLTPRTADGTWLGAIGASAGGNTGQQQQQQLVQPSITEVFTTGEASAAAAAKVVPSSSKQQQQQRSLQSMQCMQRWHALQAEAQQLVQQRSGSRAVSTVAPSSSRQPPGVLVASGPGWEVAAAAAAASASATAIAGGSCAVTAQLAVSSRFAPPADGAHGQLAPQQQQQQQTQHHRLPSSQQQQQRQLKERHKAQEAPQQPEQRQLRKRHVEDRADVQEGVQQRLRSRTTTSVAGDAAAAVHHPRDQLQQQPQQQQGCLQDALQVLPGQQQGAADVQQADLSSCFL